MNKLIMAFLLIIMLSGCENFGEPRVETEYQEVKVPISNIPEPPNTDCPETRIETIPSSLIESDGEVARAYRISVEQLEQCAMLREKVINKYREMAQEDKERLDQLQQPVSSTVNGPMGSQQNRPNVQIDEQEALLQMQRQQEFENISNEFDDLQQQEFDIE